MFVTEEHEFSVLKSSDMGDSYHNKCLHTETLSVLVITHFLFIWLHAKAGFGQIVNSEMMFISLYNF